MGERRKFFAPARVNLIGEHTDYGGGLALPIAIDRGVLIDATPSERLRLTSDRFAGKLDVSASGRGAATGWASLPAAVANELHAHGRPAVGLAGSVSATVPPGAGLSSSAALGVAAAYALASVADYELPPLTLAQIAQRAEQRATGVPCGLLDQAASALATAGHALFFDASQATFKHVPFPPELAVVVLVSGIQHDLATSEYAERRRELERALRGATDELSARRRRHFDTENDRVRKTVACFESGHLDTLAGVFREGQASLRDDCDVSAPEIEAIVERAYAEGATAARMTGGGFGGSVVALVEAREAPAFVERMLGSRLCASVFATFPADGAREITRRPASEYRQ